jgi:hypothetical protein
MSALQTGIKSLECHCNINSLKVRCFSIFSLFRLGVSTKLIESASTVHVEQDILIEACNTLEDLSGRGLPSLCVQTWRSLRRLDLSGNRLLDIDEDALVTIFF